MLKKIVKPHQNSIKTKHIFVFYTKSHIRKNYNKRFIHACLYEEVVYLDYIQEIEDSFLLY